MIKEFLRSYGNTVLPGYDFRLPIAQTKAQK